MTYKELCKELYDMLGDIYFPIVYNMFKIYDAKFIIKCAESVKNKIYKLPNKKAKSTYLAGVCRNKSKTKDLIDNFELFDKKDCKI